MCQACVNTEMEMSSFLWNFHHWLHWKLPEGQLPVQPMMKILSKRWHFHFSASCMITPSSIPCPPLGVHVSKGTAPQHRKCEVIGATRNGGWQGSQPHRRQCWMYIACFILARNTGILMAECAGMFHHDDVIKWKCFPRYWPFVRGIHRSLVNSLHKGQWCGALRFSLICTWTNIWATNGDAGDLRTDRTHYDVIVMIAFHVLSLIICDLIRKLIRKY